ncbi:MAG: hypothetical protein ACN4GG_05765 [Akkermansiaceae bacterium]
MKLLLLPLTLALSSCGALKNLSTQAPEKQEQKKPAARQIIGRIASVSEAGKFVLIQKYGPGRLPKDVLFQTHSIDGSSANIRPTGERVRDFFAADIITGETKKGDPVSSFQLQPEKPADLPSTEKVEESEIER